MRIQKVSGEYEVRLGNRHLAGKIVWDSIWEEWRFVPENCRLDYDYMKKITKFMKKLK